MPRTSAAMPPSPSSLRSILHLSRRIVRPPNPRLPSRPRLLTRLRFLSSSSSSSPSGDGWVTYDPFTDSLGPSAAVSSPSASSNPDTPADSDAWGVYDSVTGRIVTQGQLSPTSSSSDGEEEVKEKEKEGVEASEVVKEKGRGKSRGGKGEGRWAWAAVAAARKAGGKAAKARVSYVCSNCGEGSSQWWGVCNHCKATGTLTKYVPEPDPVDAEGLHHAVRSWIPQKSKEMVPQSLWDVTKGFDQAEWRIPL